MFNREPLWQEQMCARAEAAEAHAAAPLAVPANAISDEVCNIDYFSTLSFVDYPITWHIVANNPIQCGVVFPKNARGRRPETSVVAQSRSAGLARAWQRQSLSTCAHCNSGSSVESAPQVPCVLSGQDRLRH